MKLTAGLGYSFTDFVTSLVANEDDFVWENPEKLKPINRSM